MIAAYGTEVLTNLSDLPAERQQCEFCQNSCLCSAAMAGYAGEKHEGWRVDVAPRVNVMNIANGSPWNHGHEV
jgi:hypothetical protein